MEGNYTRLSGVCPWWDAMVPDNSCLPKDLWFSVIGALGFDCLVFLFKILTADTANDWNVHGRIVRHISAIFRV